MMNVPFSYLLEARGKLILWHRCQSHVIGSRHAHGLLEKADNLLNARSCGDVKCECDAFVAFLCSIPTGLKHINAYCDIDTLARPACPLPRAQDIW
jgi:hypothetical protein